MNPIPTNTVICGEASTEMKRWPAESIQLIITSPPYGNPEHGTAEREYEGFEFHPESIIRECYRLLPEGRMLCWIVDCTRNHWDQSDEPLEHAMIARKAGFKRLETIAYAKNGLFNHYPDRLCQVWEYLFVFLKGDRPLVANIPKDRPNRNAMTVYHGTRRQKDNSKKTRCTQKTGYFSYRSNIWEYDVGGGKHSDIDQLPSAKREKAIEKKLNLNDHPAIFPEKLARDLIQMYSLPGELVFDPLCGIGTTLVTAKKLQRQFLGTEISSRYAANAFQNTERVQGSNLEIFLKPANLSL
jgi:DNA modification methylase